MDAFFEELKKIPIVQVACEKSNVSRNTVYRWRKEDKKFAEEMDKAMTDGIEYINDMTETQLLNAIKVGEFKAISFWLRSRHSAYKHKIEVSTVEESEELSPAQAKIVKHALSLASAIQSKSINKINKSKKHE